MIVDWVFEQINDMKSGLYTKREFSRDYLGKCGSYYSATKSKKVDVSKTALINLWRALRKEVERYEFSANKVNDNWLKHNMLERRRTFDALSKGVLEALIATDTKTNCETRETHARKRA